MAAPFCTGCGAAVAEGTRFCVKCGQPVSTAAFPTPPPPPPPLQPSQASSPLPPPPPPPPAPSISQVAQYPAAQDPIGLYPPPRPVKEGAGAGVWIAILGLMLLAAGGGLWFYTTRIHPRQVGEPVTQPTPQPVAKPVEVAAAPAPSAAPEVIPPNPDFAKPDSAKNDKAPKTGPRQDTVPPIQARNRNPPAVGASPPAPAPAPVPPQPVKPAAPTSGTLHATVEVAQYGEVVFENLPGGRLRFTFDHSAWQPTIHRQSNGTQTLVMRSLKPGIQRTCDVKWELLE